MSNSAPKLPTAGCPFSIHPAHHNGVFAESLQAGFAKAGNKSIEHFDISATVPVVIGDDVDACPRPGQTLPGALYRWHGRKGQFYHNLACRYGYEAATNQIQEHYLSGNKIEAMIAVPDALVDDVALCGPERAHQRTTLALETAPSARSTSPHPTSIPCAPWQS